MSAKAKLCRAFLFPDDEDDDTQCELPKGHPPPCAVYFEEQLHEACICGEDPDEDEDAAARNCPAHRPCCDCCGLCVGIPCGLPEYTCPAYCGQPGEPGHLEEPGRPVKDGTLERCPLCNAAPAVPCNEGCPRGWFPAVAQAPTVAAGGAA